ncbi:alpha-1,6-rhamnosyltransferase [soil metagenome]
MRGVTKVVEVVAQDLPLVSVIITCYNQARFLGEAIESVLQQTYLHFEIKVIDDGSTDDTSEVVARYPTASYIRQENQGVVAARNKGLRESKGDYVIFLDGDDRLLPTALAIGLQYLDAHPECAFVYGRCAFIAADGSPLPTWRHPEVGKEHYLALLRNNFIWMPAKVMYRRSAFESVVEFDAAADHSSDYDLYLRISRKFPIHGHDNVVAEWRQHKANTSRKSGLMLRSALTALQSQRKYVKGDRRYEEAYKAGIRYYQNIYGGQLIDEILALVKTRQWKRAVQGARVLQQYYPLGLAVNAARKIYRKIVKPEKN